MKKVEREKEEMKNLMKSGNEGKSAVQEKKLEIALRKVQGEKIKDDPKLIKKSLKRKERQIAKSKERALVLSFNINFSNLYTSYTELIKREKKNYNKIKELDKEKIIFVLGLKIKNQIKEQKKENQYVYSNNDYSKLLNFIIFNLNRDLDLKARKRVLLTNKFILCFTIKAKFIFLMLYFFWSIQTFTWFS